jgi:hypothetical protein
MTTAPTSPAVPRYVPLSRTAHAAMRWNRFTDYRFASSLAVVPIAAMETGRAAATLPIVFARAGGGLTTMVLVGLEPGRNLFVDAAGQWQGDYVPSMLRAQPFALVRNGGQSVLCFDEASPLISPTGAEPMFTEGGELSDAVRQTGEFLQQLQQARETTDKACAALERHGCLLPFSPPGPAEGVASRLGGLLRVGEKKLNQVDGAALAELRDCGALSLAYCHLVSLHRLSALVRMSAQRAQATVDLSLLEKNGTISFDAFR